MADDLGDHGDGDGNHGDCGEGCSLVVVGLVFDRFALCTVDNERGFAF